MLGRVILGFKEMFCFRGTIFFFVGAILFLYLLKGFLIFAFIEVFTNESSELSRTNSGSGFLSTTRIMDLIVNKSIFIGTAGVCDVRVAGINSAIGVTKFKDVNKPIIITKTDNIIFLGLMVISGPFPVLYLLPDHIDFVCFPYH